MDAHETASNHSGHSSNNNNNNNIGSSYHGSQLESRHGNLDNQSEYSANVLASSTSIVAGQQEKVTTREKNLKTEYKSKFKPFSEYAYNEVTDSFVKCHHSAAECSSISASRSNQDLMSGGGGADTSGAHHQQHQITISTHDADVFEPSQHADGSESHHAGGSVAEPWYKEVVKRNEKANEYRFKSEVGHNSPLLNYINRSDSPSTQMCAVGSSSNNNNETTPRQLASPSGNESLISGACENNLYEIRSQHSDQQQQASCNDSQENQQQQQQAAKAQYRFTPSSYKRDNLIAHMANNNNFNLPKEQQEAATINQQQQPRRAATATSAQARARSQSSRRPQATTTMTANNNSPRVQQSGASKSNHATPTKTLASRTNFSAARATNATSSKSHAKTVTPTSTVASRYATTTRTASSANGSGGLASSRVNTTSTLNKRTPTTAVSSTTASSRVMPKSTTSSRTSASPATSSVRKTLVSSTTSSAARPAGSSLRPKTATQGRTTTAAAAAAGSRKIESPTKISAIKAGKLPVTSARGMPSSRAAPSSSSTSTVRDKPAPATPESSSPVKSIKTRKAIESETAKAAAAAAAATAVVAAGVSAALATSSGDKTDQQQQQSSAPAMESTSIQELRYAPEEQNLIFTTTEAGDMLADELAQAEMAQAAAARHESAPVFNDAIENYKQNQVAAAEEEEKSQRIETSDFDSGKQPSELPSQGSQGDLVNGLAGGLVSAEDGFDSSERDYSSEANQLAAQHQELQNNTDEPYSIIPTAADPEATDDRSDEVTLNKPVSESVDTKPLEQQQQSLFEDDDKQSSGNIPTEENPAGEIDRIDADLAAESGRDEILVPDVTQNISKIDLDEMDNNEHLNLSSHLTNSDDELTSKADQHKFDDDEPTPESRRHQSLIEDDDESTTPTPRQQQQQQQSLIENVDESMPSPEQQQQQSLIEDDDESTTPELKQQQQSLFEDDDEQPSDNMLIEENRAGEIDGIDADLAADSGRDEILMPDVTQKISKMNLDDIDSDEHLKLSSHLTNSDDELILKPGKLKPDDDESTTPTPKQQQLDEFDAELMAKEDHVEWKNDSGDINSTSETPLIKSSVETPEPEIALGEPMDDKQSDNISSNDLWTSSPVEEQQQQAPVIKSEPIDTKEIVETETKRDELSSEDEELEVQMQNITSQPANLVDFSGFDLSDNSSNNNTQKTTTEAVATNNGLILNPSDLEGTSSRQMQASGGTDLDLMAQEDRLEGTFELSDGSSAALEIPTSIENRVEMSTLKASPGEELDIPQASFKFARKIRPDSDDEELDIDPDEDPIGSAATLSPNASVAEELMKFNAAMDNIGSIVGPEELVDLNRHSSAEMTKQLADLSPPSADDHSRNNNDLEEKSQQPSPASSADASDKDNTTKIKPLDGGNEDEDEVKPHVIGETIKQAAGTD